MAAAEGAGAFVAVAGARAGCGDFCCCACDGRGFSFTGVWGVGNTEVSNGSTTAIGAGTRPCVSAAVGASCQSSASNWLLPPPAGPPKLK